MNFKTLIKLRVSDFLQLRCLGIIGEVLYIFSKITHLLNVKNLTVELLLRSIRYSYSTGAQVLLSQMIVNDDLKFVDYVSAPAEEKDALGRAIVLSAPMMQGDKVLKGVMLLTFTQTFSFFLKHPQWKILNKYFVFVLEPSWAGYADSDILAFLQEAEHSVLQATELRDRAFVNSLFPQVPCMETGASNWVDERVFSEGPCHLNEKEYDAIYIANFNPIKRVFKAIEHVEIVKRQIPNYRMVIVCASLGSTRYDDIFEYSKRRGVEKNVILLNGMSQAKLVELVRKSKCSILLSLKEGSNRVLFESMFVNVPVICISENIGVNKSYINASTGILASNKLVSKSLAYMTNNYERFAPKKWALANISPDVTTKHLKEILESWFPERVNLNLCVKVNSPEVCYKYINFKYYQKLSELFSMKDESEFKKCAFSYFE